MDVEWMGFIGAHGALYSRAGAVERLTIGDKSRRHR